MKSPPSRCDGVPGLTWLGTTPVPPTPDGRRERRPQSVEYPQLVPKAASRFWVGDQGLLPWVPDSASMPVCWRASVLRVRPATAAASGESGVGLRPAGGTVASRSCRPEVRGRGSRRCPRSRPGGVRPGYRTAGRDFPGYACPGWTGRPHRRPGRRSTGPTGGRVEEALHGLYLLDVGEDARQRVDPGSDGR